MFFFGVAWIIPHLTSWLDPLVCDPLVAIANRTAKVLNPGINVTGWIVIEPVDSTSSFCEEKEVLNMKLETEKRP